MTNVERPEDKLAAAYRASMRREDWPGPDCPSREALERLALGEIPVEERPILADHLAVCTDCSELVLDLRSLEGWAESAVEATEAGGAAATVDAHRPGARRRWPIALAAAVVLAVAGVSLWTQRTERAPPADVVRGASETVTPAAGSELSQAPERFAWPAQRGATGFRVEVFDEDGDPVWASDWRAENSCPAPEEAAGWAAGRGYLWTVTLRGDVARSRLGPFGFRIEVAPGARALGAPRAREPE